MPTVPTPPADPTSALYAALAAAVAASKAVGKNATNSFHKYKYASAEVVYEEGRSALAAQGLTLVPVSYAMVESEGAVSGWLSRHFLLVHSGGGSLPLTLERWPVIVERGRPLDKALSGALTTSLSYMVRDLLLLPRVAEGDDIAGRDDTAKEEKDLRPQPKPKAAPVVGDAQWQTAWGRAKEKAEAARASGEEFKVLGGSGATKVYEAAMSTGWPSDAVEKFVVLTLGGEGLEDTPADCLDLLVWIFQRYSPPTGKQ